MGPRELSQSRRELALAREATCTDHVMLRLLAVMAASTTLLSRGDGTEEPTRAALAYLIDAPQTLLSATVTRPKSLSFPAITLLVGPPCAFSYFSFSKAYSRRSTTPAAYLLAGYQRRPWPPARTSRDALRTSWDQPGTSAGDVTVSGAKKQTMHPLSVTVAVVMCGKAAALAAALGSKATKLLIAIVFAMTGALT